MGVFPSLSVWFTSAWRDVRSVSAVTIKQVSENMIMRMSRSTGKTRGRTWRREQLYGGGRGGREGKGRGGGG